MPLAKKFEHKLAANESNRSWPVTIVHSYLDPKNLPPSLAHPGVSKLCEVTSNLAGVDQSQMVAKRGKKRYIFFKGAKHFILEFDMRVILGPADVRFELWFEGKKFSANHEPIKVSRPPLLPSRTGWNSSRK